MKRHIAVVVALILSSHSNAALVERDLYTAGDSLITYDDSSFLEWRDVSSTRNTAYASVYDVGGLNETEGWRHATADEFTILMQTYVADLPQIHPNPLYSSGIYVQEFLGVTYAETLRENTGVSLQKSSYGFL